LILLDWEVPLDLTDPSVGFGVASGVVQLIGYWIYSQYSSKINIGSWMIWTFGAFVELVSYYFMTEGDLVKIILPAACAVACILCFLTALVRRRFGWPDKVTWWFVGADVAITLVGLALHNATVANLLYQVSFALSLVPMLRGMMRDEEREHPFPWLVWSVAYGLFLTSVSLRTDWSDWRLWKDWLDVVYPTTGLVTHWIVYRAAQNYSYTRPIDD